MLLGLMLAYAWRSMTYSSQSIKGHSYRTSSNSVCLGFSFGPLLAEKIEFRRTSEVWDDSLIEVVKTGAVKEVDSETLGDTIN